jgi:outer membrane protein OmpA-like peptidoglycan-associated protein
MTKPLVDTLRQMITPSVTARLSNASGDSTQSVEKGLVGGAAALLGVLAARADDRGFMNQVMSLAGEPGLGSGLDSPDSVLEQAQRVASDPAGLLARFQSLLLPNKGAVVDGLARHAGVNTASALSLLGIAAGFVMALLARLVRQDHVEAGGLGRRLAAERSAINAALPPALASVMPVSAAQRTAERIDRTPALAAPSRGFSPMAWLAAALLGAIALAALLGALRGNRQDQMTGLTSPGGVGTSGYVTRTLPGRTDLRFPASSMEERLLTYIDAPSPADPEAWFEFDRVSFEPGSATLRPASREQLSNTAVILRAYPRVRVKVGGYTSSAGDPAADLRLSQARADAVAAELRSLGVEGRRIESEGYGDQHPITRTTTAGGRGEDRSVAIRVLSK